MKFKTILFIFFLVGQFCFGQTLSSKNLHGMAVNDSINIQSGYVLNLSSDSRSTINTQGFFDILAKTNDTLLISSFGLKSKKIVLATSDFTVSVFIVKLNIMVNELNEVVVQKMTIKPNLGDTKKIVNKEYMDDDQSSLKPKLPGQITYGLNIGNIGKTVWKAFVKKPDNSKVVHYESFSEEVQERINPKFLTNTLKLKQDEIGLFMLYCENDPVSKTLLEPESEFQLLEFLIVKNEEFKKMSTVNK